MTMNDTKMLEALKIISKDGRGNKLELQYKTYRESAPWSIHAATVYHEAVKELIENGYELRMSEGELMVEVN